MDKIRDIGEQGLLKIIQAFCPSEIIGDDGAVVAVSGKQSLVVTTDIFVDGVHFSDKTTTPEDVGWRAAAANLSDLAAMGATPLGITVGLSLPGDVSINWVKSLYNGLISCLKLYQTPILGGDICRSPVINIAITALGQVFPHRVIRRCAAQPGDTIIVTGLHGASRAGLELLLNPNCGQTLEKTAREALILAHQRPKPRLDVVTSLEKLEGLFRVAGMDSSDGLADAVIQICRASDVGAEINRNSLPIPSSLLQFVSPKQALDWTLYGGEDFELVLCLPEKLAQELVKNLGNNAAVIGHITSQKTVKLIDNKGIYSQEILTLESGFQHF